jgi:hypothetical protein
MPLFLKLTPFQELATLLCEAEETSGCNPGLNVDKI